MTFTTQSNILGHWSGKGTTSTIYKYSPENGHQVSEDKIIAAYNFEGMFDQLSN